MDDIEEFLDGIELHSDWMEKLPKECPFCGGELEMNPGLTSPNVGKVRCGKCGFDALISAPVEKWDKRWWNGDVVIEL